MSEEPTRELIDAARTGDSLAWERIDRRFRNVLALLMRGRVGRKARGRFDTEDVLQSVMVCAYSELDSYEYRGPGSFQRWLIAICENRLRVRAREHRAAKRDVAKERPLEERSGSDAVPSSLETPSELVGRAEDNARHLAAIAELPDDERSVVVAHFFDGQPLARIAADLGISPSAASRRWVSGVERLRHTLRATWGGERP